MVVWTSTGFVNSVISLSYLESLKTISPNGEVGLKLDGLVTLWIKSLNSVPDTRNELTSINKILTVCLLPLKHERSKTYRVEGEEQFILIGRDISGGNSMTNMSDENI